MRYLYDHGAPSGNRTRDTQIKSLVLWPTELMARVADRPRPDLPAWQNLRPIGVIMKCSGSDGAGGADGNRTRDFCLEGRHLTIKLLLHEEYAGR